MDVEVSAFSECFLSIINSIYLIFYSIFGITNNFAYVVMLSAAHDILDEEENSDSASNTTVSSIS